MDAQRFSKAHCEADLRHVEAFYGEVPGHGPGFGDRVDYLRRSVDHTSDLDDLGFML